MSTAEATEKTEATEVVVSPLSYLSDSQRESLARRFATQPKGIKKEVRSLEIDGDDTVQYAAYILIKMANEYAFRQLRDAWVMQLEVLVPRLLTKDETLKTKTDNEVAKIALEIEDIDHRAEVLKAMGKSLMNGTSDRFSTLKCIERAEELFKSVWKN